MDKMMIIPKKKGFLSLYPNELSYKDKVGDDNFVEKICIEFGRRILRGTALAYECPNSHQVLSVENLLRGILKHKNIKSAIEIGTFRGVSTALLAHYSDAVITMDIKYYEEAMYLWAYAGVMDKIKYYVVTDEIKEDSIRDVDFDFAFIDGDHEYESVQSDFEITKRCGRVLFHDYGIKPGVIKFVDSLPKNEVVIRHPFAYWEKNGNSPS